MNRLKAGLYILWKSCCVCTSYAMFWKLLFFLPRYGIRLIFLLFLILSTIYLKLPAEVITRLYYAYHIVNAFYRVTIEICWCCLFCSENWWKELNSWYFVLLVNLNNVWLVNNGSLLLKKSYVFVYINKTSHDYYHIRKRLFNI